MKLPGTRSRHRSLLLILTAAIAVCFTPWAMAQQSAVELPEAKQTTLGLYLTAAEAYEKWRADPEHIKVLDVRTTEEYLFIGHAPMAWNIPLMSQTYEWDSAKQHFAMQPNPEFISQVMEWAKPDDMILVMCRSGGRSAVAVNRLADNGFTNVFNITDGMEGDEVSDPDSVYLGQRLKNGWKNSGVPWTYDSNPEQMRFAKRDSKETTR
jgi:rhodanese-related sulfurtransferase